MSGLDRKNESWAKNNTISVAFVKESNELYHKVHNTVLSCYLVLL